MQRFLLGFCGGALALGLPWPAAAALPEWLLVAGALAAGVLAVRLLRRGARAAWGPLALGLALGLTYSGNAHRAALQARLDPAQSRTEVLVVRILTEPVRAERVGGVPPVTRFQVEVAGQPGAAAGAPAGTRLRLSWYGAPEVARGQLWRLTATVRGPWSYANPGGFDYERWLLGAGLQGTGYVRAGQRLQAAEGGALERTRHALMALVKRQGLAHEGVLLALLTGHAGAIPPALWEILRATGTVHLMVISGLHVSLAAAFGFAIARAACRLWPLLPLWLDARLAGCLGGAAVSAAYVALAGAGVPALRALLMSGATLVLLAGARTPRLGGALLVALGLLVLTRPLAVHQQGFWLSFGAVAVLFLCLGHRYGGSRAGSLLRAQLALSLGLLPLLAMTTGQMPWLGAPANLLAVPGMSLVVVPALLLGATLAAVSAAAAGWLFTLADAAVGALLQWLAWLAAGPELPPPGGGAALLVAQAGVLCWLLGAGRGHLPGLVLCCCLPLVTVASAIPHGSYRVMALDVGQGSAVAIDTRNHRLLYDAGPAFPGGFDTGRAVVVPSLAATGRARLDALILSHDDLDHTGGAGSVIAALRPRRVLGPPAPGEPACGPERWTWDGVRFRIVAVPRPLAAADNDRSCILLVDDGRRAMLIAGDIGAAVEAALLRALKPRMPRVHLMFAPHHGSRSSSSRAMLRVLRPRLVLVSAARGNRFGHPHPAVVARYRRIGARLLQTGREGAVIWHSRTARTEPWRQRAPYWRGRETGEGR